MPGLTALPYVKGGHPAVQGSRPRRMGGTMPFVGDCEFGYYSSFRATPHFVKLAAFVPSKAPKQDQHRKTGAGHLPARAGRTQFTFSQILIIATVIVISQMNFIRNADLGFSWEGILMNPIKRG